MKGARSSLLQVCKKGLRAKSSLLQVCKKGLQAMRKKDGMFAQLWFCCISAAKVGYQITSMSCGHK